MAGHGPSLLYVVVGCGPRCPGSRARIGDRAVDEMEWNR